MSRRRAEHHTRSGQPGRCLFGGGGVLGQCLEQVRHLQQVTHAQVGEVEHSELLRLTIWAARNARLDLMKLLLDRGAEVVGQDSQGRTPLMWAAFGNHAAAVRLLLQRGADPKHRDRNAVTALAATEAVGARDAAMTLR